jgi:hypothetical protein
MVLLELGAPKRLRTPLPGLPPGLRSLSLLHEVTPFVAMGMAGGGVARAPWRPASDPITVVGAHLDLGGPLVRLTVGWEPRTGGVQLLLDAHPSWWPIL